MKHILIVLIYVFGFLTAATAQNNGGKFDLDKYNRDLEATVIKEAKITCQESKEFLPIFREMHQKLRELYKKQRKCHKVTPTDENSALCAIKDFDNVDLEIKKLQQCYHQRFLKVLPATKVLLVIKAEEHYNRNLMRNYANKKKKEYN